MMDAKRKLFPSQEFVDFSTFPYGLAASVFILYRVFRWESFHFSDGKITFSSQHESYRGGEYVQVQRGWGIDSSFCLIIDNSNLLTKPFEAP